MNGTYMQSHIIGSPVLRISARDKNQIYDHHYYIDGDNESD
jgi:hypothetical protein